MGKKAKEGVYDTRNPRNGNENPFLSRRRVRVHAHERTPDQSSRRSAFVARGNAKWSRLLSWMEKKGDIGKRRKGQGHPLIFFFPTRSPYPR